MATPETTNPLQPKDVMAAMIEVYTVHTTINEYGKAGALIGVYTDEAEADATASGRGWYGGKASVRMRAALLCGDDNVVLLPDDRTELNLVPLGTDLPKVKEEMRKQALAKLTKDEIKLLGIKP